MIVAVAGSRSITNADVVCSVLDAKASGATQVVTGGARGVDTIAFDWAWAHGIPVQVIAAEWSRHGRAAGPIRNREIARLAERLIAIHDGHSRGTMHMIESMRNLRKPVEIILVDRARRT